MSKKKKYPLFHVGKNIPKNDKRNTPFVGEPNTNLDTYDKRTGKLHQRRKFGRDGNAYVDLDVADDHKSYDHAHDIHNRICRQKDRQLNKKEKRELNKAKRKRRFWNDKK